MKKSRRVSMLVLVFVLLLLPAAASADVTMSGWLRYTYNDPLDTNTASVALITNDTAMDFPAGSLYFEIRAADTAFSDPGSYTEGMSVIFYQIPDGLPAQGVLNDLGVSQNMPKVLPSNPLRMTFILWYEDNGLLERLS